MDFLDVKNLSLSWELPYYFDGNGFLIVSSMDPCRYRWSDRAITTCGLMNYCDLPSGDWRTVWIAPFELDIKMMILTEQLDAGWCAAWPILGRMG